MRLNPYLTFDGNCEEAFRFYESVLNGRVNVMLTYGESPLAKQVPTDWSKKILHVTLTVGDFVLQGGDVLPERYLKPQGISVMLNVSPEEADRIFPALAENGTVEISLQETFWASRFAMLVDQFGTPWMINCGRPSSSD